MGRARAAQIKSTTKTPMASTSTSSYTAAQLLAKAESILASSGDVELAQNFAERAQALCGDNEEERTRCSEFRGMIAMEMGNTEMVKEVA